MNGKPSFRPDAPRRRHGPRRGPRRSRSRRSPSSAARRSGWRASSRSRGCRPDTLRAAAQSPGFLAGLMDYVVAGRGAAPRLRGRGGREAGERHAGAAASVADRVPGLSPHGLSRRSAATACARRSLPPRRCPACGSPRLLAHPERDALAIAHVDCDAFYAAVEKRDDPALRDRPVIVGGGKRGVVATACYVARTFGVRSAMPMFKALKACPDAVVIRPDIDKYRRVGREVRALMLELTPLVEPVSIDEAFLDLSGTERLHHASPAVTLVRFAKRVEDEIGITVSVGLSHNKFLAKLASDLDKPRGFSIIGRAETAARLADLPVGVVPGIGAAAQARLAKHRHHPSAPCARHAARRPRPACSGARRPSSSASRTARTRGRCARSGRRRASRPRPPSTPTCAASRSCRPSCGGCASGCRGG